MGHHLAQGHLLGAPILGTPSAALCSKRRACSSAWGTATKRVERHGMCLFDAGTVVIFTRDFSCEVEIALVGNILSIMVNMGMDQYLLIPFLGEWTSICQLFWCEQKGYKVLTHCHMVIIWLMMVNNNLNPYPICSMVLVYLPTKLGDFVRANIGKYSIHGASGY